MPEQVLNEKQPAEKPFPWRCPNCRQLTVTRVAMPYRCQRTHRGRVVTVEVPNLTVPRCSNCGEVVFDYVADEQIRATLRTQLDADAKRTQRLIKYLFSGLAVLGFVTGFVLLVNGESVAAAFMGLLAMMGLLAGAFANLRISLERIEDYLLDRPSL